MQTRRPGSDPERQSANQKDQKRRAPRRSKRFRFRDDRTTLRSIAPHEPDQLALNAHAVGRKDAHFVRAVGGFERDRRAAPAEALQRRFLIVDQRHDDVAGVRVLDAPDQMRCRRRECRLRSSNRRALRARSARRVVKQLGRHVDDCALVSGSPRSACRRRCGPSAAPEPAARASSSGPGARTRPRSPSITLGVKPRARPPPRPWPTDSGSLITSMARARFGRRRMKPRSSSAVIRR